MYNLCFQFGKISIKSFSYYLLRSYFAMSSEAVDQSKRFAEGGVTGEGRRLGGSEGWWEGSG